MQQMFAVLVAGQLIQTDGEPVDETKVVFNIQNLQTANHIVVMMTGTQPFPQGYAGSVYLSWTNQSVGWSLIGHISNNKPSAIFKITGLKNADHKQHAFTNISFNVNNESHCAQVGISIEREEEIANQVAAKDSTASHANTFNEFTSKMCASLFNYASSFSCSISQIKNPHQQLVPLSVLEDWFRKFESKLKRDVYFWRN